MHVFGEKPQHSEKGIFLILSHYAVMQVVLALSGIIRNKVVALRLGPSAFGEFSQIAAIVGTVINLVSFGMGVSLSRNVAKGHTIEERQAYLANANGIVLSLSLIALVTMMPLLLTGHLLGLVGLTEDPQTVLAAAILLAAIPFMGLLNNYLALLQGILDVKGMAVWRSGAVLLATVLSVPTVWYFGFSGAAVQFVMLSVLVSVLLGWRTRRLGYRPLAFRFDARHIAMLASFGIVSMVSGTAQSLSDTAVRTALIVEVGATANGILQASDVVATTLKGILLGSIGSVSLATVARMTDKDEISTAIDRLLNVVIPLGAVAFGLLGLLGVPAMFVLYSTAFTDGAALFPYILSADLMLVFVWVVGSPLLAAGDLALWLALDLLLAITRWAVGLLLLSHFGVLAVVIGLLVATMLHLALTFMVFRIRYELHLAAKQVYRLLWGIGFVVSLSVTGAYALQSVPAMSAATLVWLSYVVYWGWQSDFIHSIKRRFLRG